MSILEQAKAVQGKRKKRYGDADKKRNSKIRRKPTEKNLEVWSRNPGRSDMIGVDGEGTPTLKRDQEPTPRPKRKKAAPKRKKAEVKVQPKAEPKPQPKEEPKKGELTGVVEKKKKEESNEVGGFTLRKWVPGSDDSEAYQIYEGEVGNLKLVGLLFKRKADKYERDGFYVRRDPWGYMLYEQGQIIYTSSVYDGFKTKEKAIFGLKNRIGFSMIHRFWENVTNSYKRNAGKARDLRIEAEAYRVLTEKDGAKTLNIGYGNFKGTHSMGYLYSKGYVIPIPSGWQIGTPDMKNFDLKKGSNFDKWENPASQVNALNEIGEWWAEKGQGRAVSDLQEIAKQYGMSKSYNFADLGEYQRKRLKDILPISIDEAKVRDEYREALSNMKGVSNRFRNYWNLFVEIAEDEVPLKNASDAMRDLTYRDYDEAGGRRRKMYLTDISRAETDALQVLLQRNNLGQVSQEQIEFIFKDDGVTAYMYRMRHKLFQLLNNVFAGLSRQASSAYTGGGNFPVARMQKIQDQNEKKERLLLEEIKKYESVLKSYFKGTKYEEKQELEQRRERAEKLGLKTVRKEVDLGVWEYDPGTSRLNFEPAKMLDPDMRTKLRRSPYAMKWSPRFKQYTRVVSLGSVPTVGLRNALKRDFDFDLPLPIDAKAAAAPKADNEEIVQGRRIKQRPDGLWEVQSEENRQRAERGEPELGGNLIYSTREEAIEDLNQQAEVEKQNEAFRAEVDAREAKIAQAKAEKEAPLKEYLSAVGGNQMETGKLKKTLQQPTARRNSVTGKVYQGTRQEVIAEMIKDGWYPGVEQVPALKQKKRAELNRMDVKQYEAWEKKRKEAGSKAEYVLKASEDRFFVVTKAEYDYAVWLTGKKDNPESIIDNLSQSDRSKVSMKIDELAKLADEARAKGEAAPNYNLCEITIPGTNIYCEGNKGIERAKMPQFKGTPVPGSPASKLPKDSKGEVDTEPIFRKQLKEEGIAITPKEIYSDNLKATQSELVGAKVAGMTKALEKDPNHPGITAPIFVSNDNYVIDGHHRWAAVTSYAIKNGLPKKMKVEVIDLPIEEAIRKSNEFADMIGIAQKAAKTEGESKPEATERRKKEGGLSARKRRKAERMNAASAAPIDVPKQERSTSTDSSNRFGFTDWGQKAKEHIQAIFDVQDAYKAKLVNLKSTRESIEESYQNFWLQVGFDKALNTDNLIAHLELCDALDVKLRPQYPSLASEQLGLALTKKAGNVLLGSRFKGKLGLVTAEMQTRIDEGKQMRFGTFRNTMTDSGKYDVERLLKALNPITKLYLSNDELRPVMMGVAINMDNEVAMTNAHVLWYGRFQEIDKTIPYFENGIILPNGNLAFDPKSKRYMGIDEQINKEIGFIKGRSAYDPRQIIIIPEENNGSKRGGGMFARPYERIEGLYPNYKAVVPDTMEGNVVMSKEEFVQAYKAFTFMVNYGLTSKNQTGDIKTIVVTFGSGVKTENIFTFDAENLKKLFVTGFFMGSTRYVWEYQDGPGRATVLKYNIDDPMNTESFSLIMPVYMNRETISFSRGPSFAKGGVIDEVEVVDIAPKTGVRIERFRQLREAMTFNGKSAKDFKGKVVVATLKVNGELINVHEFEPSQLQDAYKACILDLAAGVVLMNFSLMDLEPGQNNPQWNKWQPGFHKFQKNTGINLLQAENFRTESSFSQAYATGGIIPRKEEKESYIKQMERFEPQFVVRDTSKAKSEIVDVGDFNPGVDLTVKSASDAGAIFRKFYDPDALRSIEQTFVLYLDKNNKAKYIYFHSQGGQASTVIAATLILNVALQTKCPKFVLAHNHPSGTMIPSAPDKISGKALKKGAEMIGVEMIGSIIISGDINNEKTADVPLDYERGGYVHGPSHAEGGVTMPVGSSGRMVELEGGEGVVNKRSMASQKTITLNGKRMKPCQAVSQINQMDGNGVPITC